MVMLGMGVCVAICARAARVECDGENFFAFSVSMDFLRCSW